MMTTPLRGSLRLFFIGLLSCLFCGQLSGIDLQVTDRCRQPFMEAVDEGRMDPFLQLRVPTHLFVVFDSPDVDNPLHELRIPGRDEDDPPVLSARAARYSDLKQSLLNKLSGAVLIGEYNYLPMVWLQFQDCEAIVSLLKQTDPQVSYIQPGCLRCDTTRKKQSGFTVSRNLRLIGADSIKLSGLRERVHVGVIDWFDCRSEKLEKHGERVNEIIMQVAQMREKDNHIIEKDLVDCSSMDTNSILKAVDDMIARKSTENIVAINASWNHLNLDQTELGYDERSIPCEKNVYAVAFQRAIWAGMSVVVAAGNLGDDRQDDQIAVPACAPGVISVSSVRSDWFADTVASDAMVSPILTLLAPGVRIPTSDFLGIFNGTSAAAPHVTGAIALLKSMVPDLTPAQIRQILSETGKLIEIEVPRHEDPREPVRFWTPRLDVYAAVQVATGRCQVVAVPDVSSGSSIQLQGGLDSNCYSIVRGNTNYAKRHRVSVQEGQHIHVEASGTPDVCVWLIGPDRTVYNPPRFLENSCPTGFSSRLANVQLPRGEYTIEVISRREQRTARYDLKVSVTGARSLPLASSPW